jgi:hypothetical protein
MSKVRDDAKVVAGKRSLLDDNEMLYAQQIYRYNEMVVHVILFCISSKEYSTKVVYRQLICWLV